MNHHRIYICGPLSAPTRDQIEANIQDAVVIADWCMERGHDAHCPHAATDPIEVFNERYGRTRLGYEDYMRLDLGLIEHWATALFYLRPSPGADRELAAAQAKGLVIFRDISEVPNVRQGVRA